MEWTSRCAKIDLPMQTATSPQAIEVILKFLSRTTPKGQVEEQELLAVMQFLKRLSVSQPR